MSAPKKSFPIVGVVVAVLIVAAVGSIGVYQLAYAAPNTQTTCFNCTSSTTSLAKGTFVNVTIPSGAGVPPANYAAGAKTQYGYNPDSITVVLGKNSTVIWTNDDAAIHTATSDTAGVFNSGNIAQGATAEFTFTTPGTYTYHCIYHPWMQGTIIVKSG